MAEERSGSMEFPLGDAQRLIDLLERMTAPSPFDVNLSKRREVFFSPVPVEEQTSAVESLRQGRDDLHERGWTKETLWDEKGSLCTVGALVHDDKAAPVAALKYLALAAGLDDWRQVDSWNDDPARTEAEVFTAYDLALKMAEEDAAVYAAGGPQFRFSDQDL